MPRKKKETEPLRVVDLQNVADIITDYKFYVLFVKFRGIGSNKFNRKKLVRAYVLIEHYSNIWCGAFCDAWSRNSKYFLYTLGFINTWDLWNSVINHIEIICICQDEGFTSSIKQQLLRYNGIIHIKVVHNCNRSSFLCINILLIVKHVQFAL